MTKILFILSFIIFSGNLFAQTPVTAKPPTKRELAIRQINGKLEKSIVLDFLRQCMVGISRGGKDGKELPTGKYFSYNITIKIYLKHRWFIADTGLSKRWLSDIQKLVEYMYKTRDIIQTATNNNQTESAKYKQAVKYFDVAQKRFIKLVKKPVKVSNKIKRRAKVARVLWEKSMKKKYKIKDKEKTGLEEF